MRELWRRDMHIFGMCDVRRGGGEDVGVCDDEWGEGLKEDFIEMMIMMTMVII
jgi:hypothetical protein